MTGIAAMITLRCLITFVLVVQKLCHGQKAVFDLFSIETCDVLGDVEPYEYELSLKEVGENELAADGFVTITEPVTTDFGISIYLEKWEDGQWKEHSTVDGKLWDYIQKYIPRAYDKLTTVCQPNLPSEFPIEEGSYKAEDYQVLVDDYDIPAGMKGRFQMTIRVNSLEGNVMCVKCDTEIS